MAEVDALVVAPDLGCFCIEVKDYRSEWLEAYGEDELVTSRGSEPHPLKQAQEATFGLLNHLATLGLEDRPFFYATVAFPQIRRADMYDAFGTSYTRHFEGMIFAEDLGSSEALCGRLLATGRRRPRGRNFGHFRPSPAQADAVVAKLTRRVTRRYRAAPDDVARAFARNRAEAASSAPRTTLKPPRAEERRKLLRRPGASRREGLSRVVLHGKPGTGKTTELLQIAQAHALAGRTALVCCFNKVLAADLRARIASLPSFDGARERLVITHLDALATVAPDTFDTVCVDEAQDVGQEAFTRLGEVAREAEWFLSDSPGQALYATRSTFLDDAVATARANGTWEALRFNRRSGVAERLVADAALELSPDVNAIPAWVIQHPIRLDDGRMDGAQEALDLDLPPESRGHLPEIVQMGASGYRDRVDFWRAVIDEEMGRVRAGADLDLAIVTLKRTDGELGRIKDALTALGLPYLDQVDDGGRGRVLERGVVRIVTVHSMRGVDASRVLLLGLEHLESFPENQNALLNIALSRGRHGMRVVVRPAAARPGTHRAFVEGLVAAYSESLVVASAAE